MDLSCSLQPNVINLIESLSKSTGVSFQDVFTTCLEFSCQVDVFNEATFALYALICCNRVCVCHFLCSYDRVYVLRLGATFLQLNSFMLLDVLWAHREVRVRREIPCVVYC